MGNKEYNNKEQYAYFNKDYGKNIDYKIIKKIGYGYTSEVFLIQEDKKFFAMKKIDKTKENYCEIKENIKKEIQCFELLNKNKHPFAVNLIKKKEDEKKILIFMEFVSGGDLFFHTSKEMIFNEERIKFYAAELFLIINHLHKLNIIYRDLKLENILIDKDGHIKLCDFGLIEILKKDNKIIRERCGTNGYIAPEILVINPNKGYGFSVDWWGFGLILLEMALGCNPFYDENLIRMNYNIINLEFNFSDINKESSVISENFIDLISGLLKKNPDERLGTKSEDNIKNHLFFEGINFDELLKKNVKVPYIPKLININDIIITQ